MYEIAVCDDCVADRNRLIKLIGNNVKHDEFRIHKFSSGLDLLKAMEDIQFAAVFLDIQMKKMDGELTAKKMRELDTNLILVFYTGYAEPSPRSIEVQPYRYIMKNMTDQQIDEYVSAALDRMMESYNIPHLITNLNKKQIVINPKHVVYIEKYKKSTRIHLVDYAYKRYHISADCNRKHPDIRLSEPLENTFEKLKKYGFGCPHASYIINFDYLQACTGKTLELTDTPGDFPIARSKAKAFNAAKAHFIQAKYVGGGEIL